MFLLLRELPKATPQLPPWSPSCDQMAASWTWVSALSICLWVGRPSWCFSVSAFPSFLPLGFIVEEAESLFGPVGSADFYARGEVEVEFAGS